MLFFDGAFGLILLGLWLFCLFDVITTDSAVVRNLPKLLWVVIVLVLPDLGSILWLVAGRPWNRAAPDLPYRGNRGNSNRGTQLRLNGTNPDDDEAFLQGLRERAAEQRRRAQEQQNRAEGQRPQSEGPDATTQ